MRIQPCRCLWLSRIQKYHLKLLRCLRNQIIEQTLFGLHLFRIQHQIYLVLFPFCCKLLPCIDDVFVVIILRHLKHGIHAKDLHKYCNSIPQLDVQPVTTAEIIDLWKIKHYLGKFFLGLIIPSALFSNKRKKLISIAQLRKLHRAKPRDFIELHILIIKPHIIIIRQLWNLSGHNCRNRNGVEVLEYTDPLIALKHIIPVHVLKCLDWISDSLIHLCIWQIRPLHCKFGFPVQYRHKICRKWICPAHGACSYNEIQRHLDQPHILLCLNICLW